VPSTGDGGETSGVKAGGGATFTEGTTKGATATEKKARRTLSNPKPKKQRGPHASKGAAEEPQK
jgi:hypothetical protein